MPLHLSTSLISLPHSSPLWTLCPLCLNLFCLLTRKKDFNTEGAENTERKRPRKSRTKLPAANKHFALPERRCPVPLCARLSGVQFRAPPARPSDPGSRSSRDEPDETCDP